MGLVQPPISFGVLRFFLVAGPRHQGKASVLEIRQIWAISMKFWEGNSNQEFQVPKMQVLNLIGLFVGWGFPYKPYIQLI